jgi:hypothetical protein
MSALTDIQCKLFHSIKPLFLNKPVILVINKIDIVRLSDLSPDNRAFVETITADKSVTVVEASTYSEEGVINVRNTACEALLAQRVEQKLKGSRIASVANKIHVAVPVKRDDVERKPFIPEAAKNRVKYDKNDPDRRRLERDDEQALDGVDIYSVDTRSEFWGKTVADLRKLHPRRRLLEVRQDARVLQRKERCRFHRPGHRGEVGGLGARRGGLGGTGILRLGPRGHCKLDIPSLSTKTDP